jgi:hypothetical protein
MADSHEAITKELARADPLYLDPDCDALVCILCRAKVEENDHRHECVWLRAKKLVEWCAAQEQLIAGTDLAPTQGPKF